MTDVIREGAGDVIGQLALFYAGGFEENMEGLWQNHLQPVAHGSSRDREGTMEPTLVSTDWKCDVFPIML